MARIRSHYWVYFRGVNWLPDQQPEIERFPWWFVQDVWARSAERAIEIVKARLCKFPGGEENLEPAYLYVPDALRPEGLSTRVEWRCGPKAPEDDKGVSGLAELFRMRACGRARRPRPAELREWI